ncbi:MAG TPA: transcription elongation factor GreA [Clostridiales bacterium]|uniref:transcription elongation factor GreA n=1 Tax=Candidatus Fimenecus sp. TaxID=3022888 RepID=UPI000EE44777|nr:transcription elongation factor GreA [Clostridiales bacterium]
MMAEVQLTEAGRKELEARLDYLKSVRRAEIAEEIKTARGFGDLSENAEYDAARKAQAEMEGEIAEIEAQLRLAKIIHEVTVTCCEVKDGVDQDIKTYTIVGTTEADLANGRISDESPVGAALIRSKSGELVNVALPNGRTKVIKVIKVTR